MARKSEFSEAQIIGAIKEVEAGLAAKDVARKLGVSYETTVPSSSRPRSRAGRTRTA